MGTRFHGLEGPAGGGNHKADHGQGVAEEHRAVSQCGKAGQPGIIEYLISEGYQIVPVSELLLSGEYDIDNTGRVMALSRAKAHKYQ